MDAESYRSCRLSLMRTYVRNVSGVRSGEGTAASPRAPYEHRRDRGAAGLAANDDLLLGAGSAARSRPVQHRARGQPSDAAEVPTAAQAGLRTGARGVPRPG